MAPSRSNKPPSLKQITLNDFSDPRSTQSTAIATTTSKSSKPRRISKKPPKPTSAVSTGSEPMLTDVLLSIKPVHLANIVSRQKNHEYRKYRLRDEATRLWFYETSEGGQGRAAVTHIAVIPASVRHTPGSVPIEPFGIGNADFNAGLKESRYGYPILSLFELVHPVTLAEMKSRWVMGGAPMGWRYVGADLWSDRWGEEGGRDEKVRQVF